ncbi:aspartate-semialdehyde dehydrogenase [Alishewanella sp. d11]|uniref:aspartate-semialdehyde dehydrogenase n=1 Tax=Alishewanella sp. d11 TaxID=3414030 RepID=UPI003BF871DA
MLNNTSNAGKVTTDVVEALFASAKAQSFAGYDPFDGLNSKLFSVLPFLKKGLFGLAWIQLHKRSPINLRPLLGVPKARNPKGVGLYILGMLQQYKQNGDASLLTQACELADWLLSQQSDKEQWQHACWGYHFDWNARAFFVPKGKPNVITTIYVAQALFALSKVVDKPLYRTVAFDAANFIVKTLFTQHEGRTFFAYIPGETAFVHNASLWGAAWVAIVAAETQNKEYAELALQVARQSVAEQGVDGSWVYGSRHHHQFIDGFHTGYNLEALHHIRSALTTTEFDQAITKGLAFYKAELFEKDGTAKYYHNNRYPLDMHSVAQAVITLIRVGGTAEDMALAEKCINWSIGELYMPKQQRFVYQKSARYTNKVNYMRWTQAWVYYSFALFNRVKAEQDAKD